MEKYLNPITQFALSLIRLTQRHRRQSASASASKQAEAAAAAAAVAVAAAPTKYKSTDFTYSLCWWWETETTTTTIAIAATAKRATTKSLTSARSQLCFCADRGGEFAASSLSLQLVFVAVWKHLAPIFLPGAVRCSPPFITPRRPAPPRPATQHIPPSSEE